MGKLTSLRRAWSTILKGFVGASALLIITPVLAAASYCYYYQETYQQTSANDPTSYSGIERYISANSFSLNGSIHFLEWLLSCKPTPPTPNGYINGCDEQSQVGVALGDLGLGGCGVTTWIQIYYEAIDHSSNPYYCHYLGVGPANPNFYEILNVGRLPDGKYQYQAWANLNGTITAVGYAEFTNSNSAQVAGVENLADQVNGGTCGSLNTPAYFGTDAGGTPQSWSVLLLRYGGAWSWWGTGQSALVQQGGPYTYTQLNQNGAFRVTGS